MPKKVQYSKKGKVRSHKRTIVSNGRMKTITVKGHERKTGIAHTPEEIAKVWDKRTSESQKIDLSREAKIISPHAWIESKGIAGDLQGIDTKKEKSLISKVIIERKEFRKHTKNSFLAMKNNPVKFPLQNSGVSWDSIIPKKWAEHRNQYVALIQSHSEDFDGLQREFISRKFSYSKSGATAEFSADEPTQEKTLIEIRDGYTKTIYRKENNKWVEVAKRLNNNEDWKLKVE